MTETSAAAAAGVPLFGNKLVKHRVGGGGAGVPPRLRNSQTIISPQQQLSERHPQH